MEIVLPRRLADRIVWASLCSFISAVYAWSRGYSDLGLVPASVGVSSVVYWMHPDYSWRRYVDMAVVQVALWYQVYRAWGASRMVEYYLITGSAVIMFSIGLVAHRRGHIHISTLCHCALHVLANLANVVLYSGHVPPPNAL